MEHSWLRQKSGRLLAVALMAGLVACGDDAPTRPSLAPSDDSASTEVDPGTPAVDTPVGDTPDADSDAGPTDIADEALPVGTEPGFVGSPYTASTFPLDQLHSVLPPDAIPALTDPEMVRRDQVDFLSNRDLVFGLVINGEARAYPHNIGWWHEIVNDKVGGHPVSVTFCPLTGTGLVFDGETASGGRLELGVSGMLYNTNLVMFDRDNLSLYPQIYAASVSGVSWGETLTLMPGGDERGAPGNNCIPTRSSSPTGPMASHGTGSIRMATTAPTTATSCSPSDRPWRRIATDSRRGFRRRTASSACASTPMPAPTPAQMGNQAVVNDIGGHEIAVVYDSDESARHPLLSSG